ncbi:MAG: hypothetical protein K8R74_00950 [Bacteroidales bacterium]|nr:hypothetical protein [Bacteroidales bacterium]
MIKKYYLFTVLLAFIFNQTQSQGIVIDHHCTDLPQIPMNWIDSAQANQKWHYAHTLHGGQLVIGLYQIETNDPTYDIAKANSSLPNVAGALCIFDGQEDVTYIVPEEYWRTAAGMNKTRDVLNHNPTINVSQWCWCTQVNTYSENDVQEYLDSISVLEVEFPDVTFAYMTGNAQTGPGNHYNQNLAQGYNRYLRNEQIRNYCINNNKVLFDFGDIDCWWYNPTSEEWEWSTYEYWNGSDTVTVPFEHPQYNLDQAGHTSYENCEHKGMAVWWMMAKLAGWHEGISLDIKVFLEGSFNGTDMNTDLTDLTILPLSQPYDNPPWNYAGTENVLAIPNPDIVDWLLVELRDAPDAVSAIPSSIIEKQAAFLKKDGTIVGLDGTSNLIFNNTIVQQLFLVLWHRNHLGVMSAYPLIELDGVYNYDFTDQANKAYGDVLGQNEIATGVWGMIAGDGNCDGQINATDKSAVWETQAGEAGYTNGDFNMNGQVINPDKNDFWILNSGRECQVPD